MSDGESRDRMFGEALARRPDLGERALGIIDETGGSPGCLLARRVLEHELGAGPGGLAEWVYREASASLRASGHEPGAFALRLIADTSSVLAAVETGWQGRYIGRPPTAAELRDAGFLRSGVVLPSGPDPATGADGALYQDASIAGKGGASRPAVIVTGHAGASEVVAFRHEYQQETWLADRLADTSAVEAAGPDGRPLCWSAPAGSAPLHSCDDGGPNCRTAREELVLAWLLRGGEPAADLRMQLQTRTFTTFARSEAYLAWLASRPHADGTPGTCAREELARQMLFAPAWAAGLVGWPFGHQALAYFDRLAATPVTPVQGAAAGRALIAEDTAAVAFAAGVRPGSAQARARARLAHQAPRPRPGHDQDAGWQAPRQRRPDGPPTGPTPRM